MKPFKPSVKYDGRYKQWLEQVKWESRLDGAQILRLALFTAHTNPEFLERLKVDQLPEVPWNPEDDNMWLLTQGDDAAPVKEEESEESTDAEYESVAGIRAVIGSSPTA